MVEVLMMIQDFQFYEGDAAEWAREIEKLRKSTLESVWYVRS